MADTYICQLEVCMCCLQAAAYAEPCGCETDHALSLMAEGDYLTMGNGMSNYAVWETCAGCGVRGGEFYPMGYWRNQA